MKAVVVFDGDNTLWDTDGVFAAAQSAMLATLRDNDFWLDPERDFATLRTMDRKLCSRTGVQEYNFERLALALIGYSRGLPPDEAVQLALEAPKVVAKADLEASRIAVRQFREALLNPAELLPGSREVLAFIRSHRKIQRLAAILVSEGKRDRVLRTIRYHGLNDDGEFFDYVLFGRKDVGLFRRARSLGVRILGNRDPRFIVVGDSLGSDIRPANLAGAITVYKPSVFLGEEVPVLPEETPDHRISSLHELVPILESMLAHRQDRSGS